MPGRDRKKRNLDKKRKAEERLQEGPSDRQMRLEEDAERHAAQRRNENEEEYSTRLAARRELNRKRLERAVKEKAHIAKYDDVQNYQEANHTDSIHRLKKTSIFDCPKCPKCEAYVWPEEKPSFCCNRSSKNCIDLNYPQPGSIPPQPPTEIKDLFKITHFIDHIRQYNNALAMASIGIKESRVEGNILNNNNILLYQMYRLNMKYNHVKYLNSCFKYIFFLYTFN